MVRSAPFLVLLLTCCAAIASAFMSPPDKSTALQSGKQKLNVFPPKAQKAGEPRETSDPKTPRVSPLMKFMHRKLTNSSNILEGLVTDDFKKIEDGAAELLKMSNAEQWRAHNDMMYLQHSREFRTAVKALQKKAKDQSIDGAGLAYMNVTMSCIRCHEWVRNVIVADNR